MIFDCGLRISLAFMLLAFLQGCGSPPKPERPSDTGRRLSAEAALAHDSGKVREAVALYADALKEYTRVDDTAGIARVSNNLAVLLALTGKMEAAESTAIQALATYRKLGDDLACARALLNLGSILLQNGKPAEAREIFDLVLPSFAADAHPRERARALLGMAQALCGEGKAGEAWPLIEESRILFGAGIDMAEQAAVEIASARVSCQSGNLVEAMGYALKALELDKARGASLDVLNDLEELGNIYAHAGGQNNTAADYYTRALASARALRHEPAIKRLQAKLAAVSDKER
ncbi:MAG: hypothetical protein A2Z34_04525 [Planctomycetes bacterium RBG_16_59_8]|nr:MAG: hypothetical protein A2Z34_04525 [Planctomycetes bacterium RBG_16_59_8]